MPNQSEQPCENQRRQYVWQHHRCSECRVSLTFCFNKQQISQLLTSFFGPLVCGCFHGYCLPMRSGAAQSSFHPLRWLSRLIRPDLCTVFFPGQKVRQEVRRRWLLQLSEGRAQWKQMRVWMPTEWGSRTEWPRLWEPVAPAGRPERWWSASVHLFGLFKQVI